MQNPKSSEDLLFLGVDIGSSFIKIALIDEDQKTVNSLKIPDHEMNIESLN